MVINMADKSVGERIKYLRESNGFTRDAFAEMTSISTKFLYEIEAGRKGFSAEILLKISRVLSVSCDYLLTGYQVGSNNAEKVAIILEGIDPGQMGRVSDILRLIQEISIDKKEKWNGADY